MARVAVYRRALAGYARKYPLAPRYRRSERTWVTTADGVRLAVARLPGPPDARATVVLVHGFVNSSRTPGIFTFAHRLTRRVHVLVPDLRGHGASGGRCALGRLEALDVAAAVGAADPALPVVTVGTSLGAAAALLHAGTHDGVAGVIAISSPAWSGRFDRPSSMRVERYVRSPVGRQLLARLLRTRVGQCTDPVTDVETVVGRVAPAFTIIVHDPEDHYFGPEHAEHLYAAARDPKELWWCPGAGHGTDLLTDEFGGRVLAELGRRLRPRLPAPSR